MRRHQVTVIVGGIALLGLLAVFGWKSGRERVLEWRSAYLEKRAEDALENGEWSTAARLGASAYYLGEGRGGAALVTARAHLRQRSPLTVDWWRRGLEAADQPVDELRELVTLLLESGAYEESLEFLNRLLLEDPDGWETHSLWMRAMESLKRYGEALAIGEALMGREGVDWAAQRRHLELRSGLLGADGEAAAVQVLRERVVSGGASALDAARMLSQLESLPVEARLVAAEVLVEQGDRPTDALDGLWLMERAGVAKKGSTGERYALILSEAQGKTLTQVALASIRLGQPRWLLEAIEAPEYLQRGGQLEVYFEACLRGGMAGEVLKWAETLDAASIPTGSRALLSYYRAMGHRELGSSEAAAQRLRLAVEIVSPAEVPVLEAKLYATGEWDFLQELYGRLLREAPGQAAYRQKALTVAYMRADQGRIEALLEDLDPEVLEAYPVALSFAIYLRLLSKGWNLADHERLESLVARYPETFDFRLLLGFSHLLAGEEAYARGFTEQMPQLDLAAPRYLRVCASLLGDSGEQWIRPPEHLQLLPRERRLLVLGAAMP